MTHVIRVLVLVICTCAVYIFCSVDDVWLLDMFGFLPVCGDIPADKGLSGSTDCRVSSTMLQVGNCVVILLLLVV